MRNKLLSVMLVLAMMVSLFAGITVNAASPLTILSDETVLFDQNFGGLSSPDDAEDFDITGTWECTPYFMSCTSIGSTDYEAITTKESFDFTNASGFIFETKFEVLSTTSFVYLPGGYSVKYSHASDPGSYIKLLKDDVEVAQSDNTMYLYDHDTNFKVQYLDGKWTVDIYVVGNGESATIEYVDESNPELIGKFGVRVNNAYYDKFTMYNMKLTRLSASSTTNFWKYEHTFGSDDTVESLIEEGYTFSATPTIGSTGLKTPSNCTISFAPKNTVSEMFTGDYIYETKFYKYQNNGYIRFNINNGAYYDIYLSTTNTANSISLRKSGTVIETKSFSTADSRFDTYTATIKVYNGESSTRIVADIASSKSSETVSFDYTDTSSPISGGSVALIGQYSNYLTVYYMNVYSPVSSDDMSTDETILYKNVEMNKTFSSADTVDSLSAEGIALSGSPTITDANGIAWSGGANRYFTYTNATAFKGSYQIKSKFYRNLNNAYIDFSSDGTNYYRFYVGNEYYLDGVSTGDRHMMLAKCYNGTSYVLDNVIVSYTQSGIGGTGEMTINVDVKDDNTVKITCGWSLASETIEYTDTTTDTSSRTFTTNSSGDHHITYETPVDNGAPIIGGDRYSQVIGYASSIQIKSAEVTSYSESWPEEVINKTFTSADTHDSLAALGFSGISAATITDEKGIYWSSKNNRYVYYTNDSAFTGSYSFNVKGGRGDSGDARIQFAKVDSNNYYEFVSPYGGAASNPQYFQLNKVYNGTTYNLYTSSGIAEYTECGRNTYFEATVNVTVQADGSLEINILWYTGGVLRQNITYVDSLTDTSLVDGVETDNGAPITSGTGCHIYQGWATAYVNYFKLTKYNTSSWYDKNTGEPVYTARFFDGSGSGLSAPKNGEVYFDYPVSRLGTYKVIAALYENHEMTGIRVLNPVDIYGCKARLFTVSDAENANIKVFFVDSEEGLNKITEVYELKN